MIRYRCDGCGLDLARDGSNHFIVKIEAFAAAGKTEFIDKDLRRDHRAELGRLIDKLAAQSPDEIEDQVYPAFLTGRGRKRLRSVRKDLC